MLPKILDAGSLLAGYRDRRFSPAQVVAEVIERIATWPDPAVWIAVRPREELLAEAEALAAAGPAGKPLYGLPFAIKDNVDLAGLPTTAACPAFSYAPDRDAEVVARLRAAGAIAIGKTNLDQFATGLVGTRSPYGAPRSVFDPDYVSGGSSSGSAVAVASGQVAFALGTDTAGSGRVPAAFNNLVGVKPSLGLLSTRGLVPACRTLDCITVFAATVGEAVAVRRIAEGYDAADPFSRRVAARDLPGALRIGIPSAAGRLFFGDREAEILYDAAIARAAGLGHTIVEFDYTPFGAVALSLYGGAFVAERLAAVGPFLAGHADEMDPTVAEIVASAARFSAADAFAAIYELAARRRAAEAEMAKFDVMLLPTAPTTYTVAEVMADPIRRNAELGTYTNFVNLMDLAAIAVPAGFRPNGLPFGVTLVAAAGTDDALAPVADALHRAQGAGPGLDREAPLPAAAVPEAEATAGYEIVVVGAHLAGQPLNGDLVAAGGAFVRATRTAADYRLYALPGTTPPKPGLVRRPGTEGEGIEVEVWRLPPAGFAAFVAAVPAPLGIGRIRLADGSQVPGFLCESHAAEGARDITEFGGWRAFRAALTA